MAQWTNAVAEVKDSPAQCHNNMVMPHARGVCTDRDKMHAHDMLLLPMELLSEKKPVHFALRNQSQHRNDSTHPCHAKKILSLKAPSRSSAHCIHEPPLSHTGSMISMRIEFALIHSAASTGVSPLIQELVQTIIGTMYRNFHTTCSWQ